MVCAVSYRVTLLLRVVHSKDKTRLSAGSLARYRYTKAGIGAGEKMNPLAASSHQRITPIKKGRDQEAFESRKKSKTYPNPGPPRISQKHQTKTRHKAAPQHNQPQDQTPERAGRGEVCKGLCPQEPRERIRFEGAVNVYFLRVKQVRDERGGVGMRGRVGEIGDAEGGPVVLVSSPRRCIGCRFTH